MKGIAQGTTLADRYELRHQLSQTPHEQQWLAQDRTLEREVTIALFPTTGEFADAALDSARRAAGVEDPRLLRVLDVGREDTIAYVVSETVHGAESIASMLQFETLHPEEARRLIGEAASGLATAAGRGLHHQSLTPHSILRTRGGSVLVTGLPTAAALAGKEDVPGDIASRDDATALVRILYAAITGRWPGPAAVPGLQQVDRAPSGRIPTLDSLAEDVPGDLDSLADDALSDDAGPASPRELARQLTPWSAEPVVTLRDRDRAAMFGDLDESSRAPREGAPRESASPSTPAGRPAPSVTRAPGVTGATGATSPAGAAPAAAAAGAARKVADHSTEDATMVGRQPAFDNDETTTFRPVRRQEASPYVDDDLEPPAPLGFEHGMEADRQSSKLAMAIVAACVLAALALAVIGVSQIGSHSSGSPAPTATSHRPSASTKPSASTSAASASPSTSSVPSGQTIPVTSATSYDPEGTGNEHSEMAANAIDSNPNTYWMTRTYGSPEFGGLKSGAGLALDLGSSQQVGSVVVDIRSLPCTIEVYVGDSPTHTGTLLGTIQNGSGKQTVTGSAPVKGQYVTVWVTKLSPIGGNLYRTKINEVEVRS